MQFAIWNPLNRKLKMEYLNRLFKIESLKLNILNKILDEIFKMKLKNKKMPSGGCHVALHKVTWHFQWAFAQMYVISAR